MEDNKVYRPEEINDNPFPDQETPDLGGGALGGVEIHLPQTIKEQDFPKKMIASEVISTVLNTQSKKILGEFQFTPTGSIQIGMYQTGSSGDIKLSPNGLVARNSGGEVTFAIDGTTGDATFKGTIQAGTVVASGALIVGTNVGLGTAQDSAGVTTIIGNTVTTSFINALNVTANAVNATSVLTVGTGNDVAIISGVDALYRLWAGNTNPALASFAVSKTGVLTATGAVISGGITATSGTIGGFTIGPDYIRDAANSFGLASTVTGGDDVRFWAGNSFANRAIAPFRVTESGIITASEVNLTSTAGANRIGLSSGDSLEFYNGGVLKGRIRSALAGFGMVADVGSYVTKANEGFFSSISTSTYTDFFKFYGDDDVGGLPAGVIEAPTSNRVFITRGSSPQGQTMFSVSATNGGFFRQSDTLGRALYLSGHLRFSTNALADDKFNLENVDTLKAMSGFDVRLQAGGATATPSRISFINSAGSSKGFFETQGGRYQADNLLGSPTNLTTAVGGYIIRDPSDAALKENIMTITDSIGKIMNLRGVTFSWRNKSLYGESPQFGMVAQEVETVLPEVVAQGEYKSINYNGIVSLLIEAIKNHERRLALLGI